MTGSLVKFPEHSPNEQKGWISLQELLDGEFWVARNDSSKIQVYECRLLLTHATLSRFLVMRVRQMGLM